MDRGNGKSAAIDLVKKRNKSYGYDLVLQEKFYEETGEFDEKSELQDSEENTMGSRTRYILLCNELGEFKMYNIKLQKLIVQCHI